MQVSARFVWLMSGLLVACGGTPSEPTSMLQAVRVEPVRTGPIVQGRPHIAEVVPTDMVRVLAQVPGSISALGPEEGVPVGRSTVLARVSAPEVVARVSRVGSERRRIERERDFACSNLETDRVLARAGDLPTLQLDVSEKQCASATLALEAATAAEREAFAVGTRATETAPFDGQVMTYLVDVGQTVMPGTPVAQFGSEALEFRMRMVASDLDGVAVGTRVVTDVGDGVVVSIGMQAQGPARLYEVLATIEDAQLLRVGQTLTATVVLDERLDTTAVPDSALAEDRDGAFVLVSEGDRLRRVDVVVGPRQGGWVAIEPSMPEGTRVVTGSPGALDLARPVLAVMP